VRTDGRRSEDGLIENQTAQRPVYEEECRRRQRSTQTDRWWKLSRLPGREYIRNADRDRQVYTAVEMNAEFLYRGKCYHCASLR